MQAVRGVVYVDIDSFGGVPEKISDNGVRRLLTPDEVTRAVQCIADPKACEEKGYPMAGVRAVTRAAWSGAAPQTVAPFLGVNRAGDDGDSIYPAQLALLSDALPDTLILNPIP